MKYLLPLAAGIAIAYALVAGLFALICLTINKNEDED